MPIRSAFAMLAIFAAACSSSSGDKNNSGDGEQHNPTGPGDFTSVWQAASAQYTYIDSANPAIPSSQTYAVPQTTFDENHGLDVEAYVGFDDTHVIRYAHYTGEDLYYRITEAATQSADTYIADNSNFTLQDGALVEYSSSAGGTQTLVAITTYSVATFPPSTWPTDVVDYDTSANQ